MYCRKCGKETVESHVEWRYDQETNKYELYTCKEPYNVCPYCLYVESIPKECLVGTQKEPVKTISILDKYTAVLFGDYEYCQLVPSSKEEPWGLQKDAFLALEFAISATVTSVGVELTKNYSNIRIETTKSGTKKCVYICVVCNAQDYRYTLADNTLQIDFLLKD